ncbi:hypothetical protein BJX62DRAFT_235332 [Aspergillus germanicus]
MSSLSDQGLIAAPTGPYFFYGTLSHPPLLRQILNLDDEPSLRPARIVGCECKLWGPYPALVDATNPQSVVNGYVYRVETEAHARRLADYETGNYCAECCHVTEDLDEGRFDLDVWLRRIEKRAGNSTSNRAPNTEPKSFEVYRVQFVGQPSHVALYIETQPNAEVERGKGVKYDVTGTILMGMEFRKQDSEGPVLGVTYVPGSKEKVATIAAGDLGRFETECCEAVAPPASQVFLNGRRKDSSKPLYRCNHWVDDVVKLALKKGIFKV